MEQKEQSLERKADQAQENHTEPERKAEPEQKPASEQMTEPEQKPEQTGKQAKKAGKLKLWLTRLSLPIYLLSMLGIDVLFQLMYSYVGGVTQPNKLGLVFTGLWVLLFGAIVLLLPRLGGRIVIGLTTVLFCVLAAVHAVMFHLFGNFFRFSDMLYAGEGAAFFSMKYVQMRKLLAVGLVVFLAAGITSLIFLPKLRFTKLRILAGIAAAAAAVAGLAYLNRTYTVEIEVQDDMRWDVLKFTTEMDPAQTRKVQYTEFLNSNACLPMVGLYQYTYRDLTKTFFSKTGQDRNSAIARLNVAHDAHAPIEDNEMTGVLEGKNLLMIMVESLDDWMITEDYMPNLYALRQKSVYLNHFYTPLYLNAGTFATEFTTQTGVIPPLSGVSTDAYMENALPAALPSLFAAQGYQVNSFHSANANIYNRGSIHRNMGFEDYHNYQAMGMDDYMIDSQMLNGFELMTSQEQPFYSFIITYSGHGPYNDTMTNISGPHLERAKAAVAASGVTASEDTMNQYIEAVAHIMETDEFIGGLLERLEEAGLMENTALIIYGDHYCKYLTDTDFLIKLKGVGNRNLLCNTPLMIYSTDLEPRDVDKYAASPDLYPTVCNLFNLDVDLAYFVGDDVFGQEGGVVYWRDNCCWDGTTYVDSTQAANLTQEQLRLYNLARQKLNLSWDAFRYDYFSLVNPCKPKES